MIKIDSRLEFSIVFVIFAIKRYISNTLRLYRKLSINYYNLRGVSKDRRRVNY